VSDQTLFDWSLSVNRCLKLFLFANVDLEECVMKISNFKLNNKICIERKNSEWSVYESKILPTIFQIGKKNWYVKINRGFQ